MADSEEFENRLKIAMEKKGVKTFTELARIADISRPTLHNAVKNGGIRNTATRAQVANALGVRTAWLKDGTGPMQAEELTQVDTVPPDAILAISWAKRFNDTMELGLNALQIGHLGMDLCDMQRSMPQASTPSPPRP
jgi:hypothetical protein